MSCQTHKIIIAVDGFSACGKSTFAREIAARLGYVFIDTGAMYRAVTLFALRRGVISDGETDDAALVALLSEVEIGFAFDPAKGISEVMLNGENVESEIRGIGVSEHVSRVSSIPEVREKMVRIQQQIGGNKGVVMDGRDIGTVVFPNAELKIFMTAEMDIRVQRRYDELRGKGLQVSREEIEKNLRERDYADQNRAVSPLRQAPDALLLDNSHMTLEQELDWVMEIIGRLCGA